MTTLPQYAIYQGDTANLDFLVLNNAGDPQDLSAATVRWAMSDPEELDTPILEKTGGDGVAITDPTGGRCTVTIPAGELATPGTFIHELEITIGGATYTYGQGPLIVSIIDEALSAPGTEVTLTWGESGGGSGKPTVERHRQVEIRATVGPAPYADAARMAYRPGQQQK